MVQVLPNGPLLDYPQAFGERELKAPNAAGTLGAFCRELLRGVEGEGGALERQLTAGQNHPALTDKRSKKADCNSGGWYLQAALPLAPNGRSRRCALAGSITKMGCAGLGG